MFAKDPELRFNIDDPFSPHAIVPSLVTADSSVLDIGCNIGYLGGYLIQKKKCIVDGVDYQSDFLAQARARGYRQTFQLDLYRDDFSIPERYDYLLFLDVLEHLPRPDSILKKFVSENLKEDGRAIICLPNVARFEFRLKHLLGVFEYENSGILSQDHLRFFTKSSAIELLDSAGLRIEKVRTTGLGARFKFFDTLTAFQFIFVASKRKNLCE